LKISLREENSRIRAIKYRRIKIRIYKIIISIKYILKGTLNIVKLLIKISLYKIIV
jgi:hypothetical protein